MTAAMPDVRLAELMASLSLATDIAMGAPLERGLRAAVLAARLADGVGLSEQEASDAYYLTLLRTVGCTGDETWGRCCSARTWGAGWRTCRTDRRHHPGGGRSLCDAERSAARRRLSASLYDARMTKARGLVAGGRSLPSPKRGEPASSSWARSDFVHRLPAVAVALLVAVSGCAGGWQEMKTRRFTAYAERPRDYRETLLQLEYSYAALSTFFPRAQVGEVEVLFMPWDELMLTFHAERGGLVLPAVPGAGRIGKGNLIVMGEAGLGTTMRLLSHLFVHRVVPNAPFWIHSGMAGYFASTGMQRGNGRFRACFGVVAPLDARFFQMPLDRFFAIGWRDYDHSDPSFYDGTARLLMDFIFHGDSGAHRAQLPAIFGAAARGQSGPQIMAATFPGMNLEQLGRRISDFKGSHREQMERGLMCPVPADIAPDRRPDTESPREAPVPPGVVAELLAALQKLPHGDYYPSWYPPEILGTPPAAR
jgi:hypothetical protein